MDGWIIPHRGSQCVPGTLPTSLGRSLVGGRDWEGGWVWLDMEGMGGGGGEGRREGGREEEGGSIFRAQSLSSPSSLASKRISLHTHCGGAKMMMMGEKSCSFGAAASVASHRRLMQSWLFGSRS